MDNELGPEDRKPYVEVSGRKGLGVKADDLIDKLEAATLAEVAQRHPEMSEEERVRTAHEIAVGALRFFLLKFTRNAIIAFDFADALSFEGETGPYCQYAGGADSRNTAQGSGGRGGGAEFDCRKPCGRFWVVPTAAACGNCCCWRGQRIPPSTQRLRRRSRRFWRSTRFSWPRDLIIFITSTIFCRKQTSRNARFAGVNGSCGERVGASIGFVGD